MPFAGHYSLRFIKPGVWVYLPEESTPLSYTRPNGDVITMDDPQLVTDKGSTPRFLWCLPGFAPSDMERPSIVHDALWDRHHAGDDRYTMRETNQILYEALIDEGYSRWKASILRWGCNVFGSRLWNRPK